MKMLSSSPIIRFCFLAIAVAAALVCEKNFYPPPQNHSANESADHAENFSNVRVEPRVPRFSDDELIAAIEGAAEQNPTDAIGQALAERDPQLRKRLLNAVLSVWAKKDAAAATDWILSQPGNDFDHTAAVASLFKASVEDPQAVARLIQQINEKYPLQADICGDALNNAFVGTENPSSATLLAGAYGCWANYQPEDAARSAMQIGDVDAQTEALAAVISTWEQIHPQGVADFVENNLPAGNQKSLALSQSLILWAAQNPVAVADWINNVPPSPDLDDGEAAIATQPQVMQQPSVAISWAETISDPNLRSSTVAAIVETWQLSDASAALDFARTCPDLLTEDRNRLLVVLDNEPVFGP